MDTDTFLEHHGIKGMKWGVHRALRGAAGLPANAPNAGSKAHMANTKVKRKKSDLLSRAAEHDKKAVKHNKLANQYRDEAKQLIDKGLDSPAGHRLYGEKGAKAGEVEFYLKHRKTKGQAIDEAHGGLRTLTRGHETVANHHTGKAARLRARAAQISHSGLIEVDESDFLVHDSFGEFLLSQGDDLPKADAPDSLSHFGRKGMKWGEHIFSRGGSASKAPPSEDKARATEIASKVKSGGGHHVLSNKELEDLTKRISLEKKYADLTSKDVDPGKKFVQDLIVNTGKQQAQIYTSKAAAAAGEALTKKILAKSAKK